jgi:orotidine-5'-phosphate decarboxylase
MAVATLTFADRLAAEVERKRSQLVVGLDPNPDLLPVELRGDVARFCCGIVDAVAPYAVAVKPQLAFFEALGPRGMSAFDQVCAYARRAGLLVIADGKRGDVGSTARAYAEAYLEGDPPRADALTVNPWLGRDAIEPFLGAVRRGGVGIFVLVRTSNAGGDVQDAVLKDGRPVWQHVAGLVEEWGEESTGEVGLSSVGAVVGATHPRAVADARRLMPRTILLLPGVGAQGGSVADLGRAFQSGPASALVAASRSVIYAYRESGADFREAAGAEASRLQREVWAASGW